MIRPMITKNNGVVKNAKDKLFKDMNKDNNSSSNSNMGHCTALPASSFTSLFPSMQLSSPLIQNSPLILKSSQIHNQIDKVEDLETEIYKKFTNLIIDEFSASPAEIGHHNPRVINTLSDLESEVCARILVA